MILQYHSEHKAPINYPINIFIQIKTQSCALLYERKSNMYHIKTKNYILMSIYALCGKINIYIIMSIIDEK